MRTYSHNRTSTNEAPVFECISMLSIAVGQTLTKYMEALMDPMFACGLSDSLTQALVDMAHYIQPIRPMIQEKLLDLLSLVLSGRPFKQLGCPENRLPPIPAFAKDWSAQNIEHKDPEIALALHTLGSFDFSGEPWYSWFQLLAYSCIAWLTLTFQGMCWMSLYETLLSDL